MKNCIALLILLLMTLASPAFAQEAENHVRLTLTAERGKVEAGDTIYALIKQEISPGWHTYWRNAGDSGEPPRFEWRLPQGVQVENMLWPVPERIAFGPLTNYGYEGEATLLAALRMPGDKLPDGPLAVGAKVEILVCKDICIPETHEISMTLNDGSESDNGEAVGAAFAKMPVDVSWDAIYSANEAGDFKVNLHFELPGLITKGNESIRFDVLPYEWGVIDNPAITRVQHPDDRLTYIELLKKRGERPLAKLGDFKALVVYEIKERNVKGAIEVNLTPDPAWLAQAQAAEPAAGEPAAENNAASPGIPLTQALLFALLGGLILNLMPCVFPILSMKALSLVKMTEKSPGEARLHGLLYTAGVLVCFAAIAGLLIALKAGGAQIGWGFQLQNPLIVLLLAYLLFLIGLNLSGFYEIRGSFTNVGAGLGGKEGIAESFLTGVLAAIVATPCTAPFMGAAMGFALTQSAMIAMTVFLALGFGLALPYLLLSFLPVLRAILPRPGHWMVVVRELLAFPMYGAVVWLVWVYSQQIGAIGLLYALSGFVGISFAVWIFRYSPKEGAGKFALRGLAVVVLLTVVGMSVSESLRLENQVTAAPHAESESAFWQTYTPELLAELEAGSAPVFVNMTAAWCITCKVNERVALNTQATKDLFAARDVHYLKGDWTNQDPAITQFLSRYGRGGVPLYVFYGARDAATGQRPEPVVLPQLLTPGVIANAVK